MPFNAAIFDMDGLLLDTERMMVEAGVAAAADLGHALPDQVFLNLVGIDRVQSRSILEAALPPGLGIDTLDTAWRDTFDTAIARGIPHRPGAAELLDQLAVLGLPRAIATNSATDQARVRLTSAGFDHHFHHVVGFDLVAQGKPSPDVYLEAARRLDVEPARAVAFEDSDHGAHAARAAGMTVVQIPDLGTPRGDHAHHVASDLLSGARAAGLIA